MSILTIFRINPSVCTTSFQRRCYMVITLHRCSYDNSTISSVNKLKQYDASLLFFPSFTFLSFTFPFNLFQVYVKYVRVVLLNLLDTKVNPNCVLFHRGQGSVALAVGASGGCLDFFSLVFYLYLLTLWETV